MVLDYCLTLQMTDETENKSAASKSELPGYKKFGGAKLVPLPTPVAQLGDEEKFPLFLGVGIALSILALITVFVLAFFSHKTKVIVPAEPGANPAISAGPVPVSGGSPSPVLLRSSGVR
jgi:hypothetical protein